MSTFRLRASWQICLNDLCGRGEGKERCARKQGDRDENDLCDLDMWSWSMARCRVRGLHELV